MIFTCVNRNVQEPLILILVGNKTDLNESRTVSREEAFLYATSIGGNYFETSTVKDQGIEQVFTATALGLTRLADRRGCNSMKRYDSYESMATVFGDSEYLLINLCNVLLHSIGKQILHFISK